MSGHGKANLYPWSVAWPEGRVPRVRASPFQPGSARVGSDHDALVFNQVLGQSYSPPSQSNSNDSSLTRSRSRGSGTDESWLSMRVTLALAVLAICLSLGGCSRPKQTAYAKPRPSPLLPNQSEFTETESATCQEGSRTDQGDRGETVAAAQEASTKPERHPRGQVQSRPREGKAQRSSYAYPKGHRRSQPRTDQGTQGLLR
jgi:hypothetical protein